MYTNCIGFGSGVLSAFLASFCFNFELYNLYLSGLEGSGFRV